MPFKIITCLLILAPCLLFSQMRNRSFYNDLQRMGLTGNVKELVTTEYTQTPAGKLEIFDFFGSNNFKHFFNARGYLASKIDFRKDGDTLRTGSVWTYSYDDLNRISRENLIHQFRLKDTVDFTYTYLGDSLSRVISLDGVWKKMTYNYLQKKERELLTTINSDSSNITRTIYTYDKFNRIIRSEEYRTADTIHVLREISYIDNTSINKYREVTTQNNNRSYSEYVYDENGNRLKWIYGNFKSDETSTHRYEYVYDDHKNWVERRHYLWSGGLHTITKRQIAYYN